ncbi:hypothetical protein NRIC_34030 [Enterococcus florum]|uniref:Uncharacterized protein n=1 Tax=Enterococcus florum TaxID=2480627 RepID=A0A4P5PIU6_9ENTE|nr:hypothetical protein [Enterococcus florum]GCF95512.1 hypothetical protein NRIC_34030 [Enterococcus florum]
MLNKAATVKLWDIETKDLVDALNDFVEDWKISKNSDLAEFLRSCPAYFRSDRPTKEAIELVLGYAKEVMDHQRDTIELGKNKIWQTMEQGTVRLTHYYEREAAKKMKEILINR